MSRVNMKAKAVAARRGRRRALRRRQTSQPIPKSYLRYGRRGKRP